MTKTEQQETRKKLAELLLATNQKHRGAILIDWVGGQATNTGRTDYYTVRLLEIGTHTKRPMVTAHLSRLAAKAYGYRYNSKREAIVMTGCGYNKAHELAHSLARLAGHAIPTEGQWSGIATP